MGYWPIFLRDTGIFVFFILGYGIFRNFWIWDIGIYFGIRVKLILGYGIFWTVYFGIWDIPPPPPPNQASKVRLDSTMVTILKEIVSHLLTTIEKLIKFLTSFKP